MGRPREFDMDLALKGAMEIFWRQGFLATNLPELLNAMGLTRGSFYKAFADKESVYLQTLDLYDREMVSSTVKALAQCDFDTATECLSVLFAPSDPPELGCFICNAMVELAPVNPRVAQKTKQMAKRLRQAILEVLLRYDLPACNDTLAELADMILHLYLGFKALGRGAGAHQDWRARLEMMLQKTSQG